MLAPDSLPRPEIIIFDVDGTLVDVTLSYRETAPIAAARYLGLLGIVPPPLTGDLYDTFKLMGGFNDDWDLTAGLLEALLAGLPPALSLGEPHILELDALIAGLRAACLPLAGLTPPLPEWETLVAASAGCRRRAAGAAPYDPRPQRPPGLAHRRRSDNRPCPARFRRNLPGRSALCRRLRLPSPLPRRGRPDRT